MKFFEGIRRLFKSLRAALGFCRRPKAVVCAAPNVEIAAEVPAVAGFVHRVSKPDFRLAARLQSVSGLNTRAGRIPNRSARRTRAVKPSPVSARGGKKVRAIEGPVVLTRRPRPAAEVIALPQKPRLDPAAALEAA
jgi:hypothetical protein